MYILRKIHPHLSDSSKQRDEHHHSHELCEEDEWSEEGPHWPQCYVKAATEGHVTYKYAQIWHFFNDKGNISLVSDYKILHRSASDMWKENLNNDFPAGQWELNRTMWQAIE